MIVRAALVVLAASALIWGEADAKAHHARPFRHRSVTTTTTSTIRTSSTKDEPQQPDEADTKSSDHHQRAAVIIKQFFRTDRHKAHIDAGGDEKHTESGYDGISAWAAVATAVFTGILIGVGIWVASNQVNLMRDLERPWLLAFPIGDPLPATDQSGDLAITDGDEQVMVVLSYRTENFGKSPAWITGRGVTCRCVPVPATVDRPHPEPEQVNQAPLAPHEHREDGIVIVLGGAERRAMLDDRAALLLHGLIKYRDIFGRTHETGFSWLFHRHTSDGAEWDDATWVSTDGPEAYNRHT